MSGTAGLRNWRGEIIQSNAVQSTGGATCSPTLTSFTTVSTTKEHEDTGALSLDERHLSEKKKKKVFRKDEFGRDIEVRVEAKRPKRLKRERELDGRKERKHKKDKRQRDQSSGRSSSPPCPQGRLVGTPPPPDPFRPQVMDNRLDLDEGRSNRPQRRQHDRNRSRSRSYSCRKTQRRSREEAYSRCGRYRRLDSSWSRSRSRGRKRSQSPPSSRSHRRRSSASVERKWKHSAFNDRSPSRPRELDPFYRPEPEAWVSRAGGVYLPRK